MELSAIQQKAISVIESGVNVFLDGEAGTGKSTVINHLVAKGNKKIIRVAPTGIAALNVNGATIHKTFKFPIGLLNDKDALKSAYSIAELFKKVDLLLIDEISMVRVDLFHAMDICLRKALRKSQHSDFRKQPPFGGLQVVVVGDFYQLPPIVKDAEEKNFLMNKFGGIHAFNASGWAGADFRHIKLTKSFRQKNPEFIENLNKIRTATGGVPYFNSLVDQPVDNAIILCTTNSIADDYNSNELKKLSSPIQTYQAAIEGDMPPSSYPTSEFLHLKIGARVMTLVNRDDYCNGETGKVLGLFKSCVKVKLDSGLVTDIRSYEWEQFDYQLNKQKEVEKVQVGCFLQIPLRLAYAITIHKSQGKTLTAGIIDLGHGAFAEGQVYVALSRFKDPTKLSLKRPISDSEILIDERVSRFYKSLDNERGAAH